MFSHKTYKSIFVLLLSTLFSSTVFAQTTLRFATWAPPSHPQNSVVIPTWAKWVEEATEGRVNVVVEYGGGHPKSMFDLVEDGVVDASWSYHGYVPGRFKLTRIVELPLLGSNAEAASTAYWRVFDQYLRDANEHDGLEVLALFTHGPAQIHTVDPLASLADLKDKKIRIGGGIQADLGARIGITGVAAPAPKVYELLQQRVIDGVFIPMSDQKFLRLNEVAPHVTALPGGLYLGSFAMFINPDFMDALDPKDRAAILSVSGEKLSTMAGRAWDAGDAIGENFAHTHGVAINNVSENDTLYKEFISLTEGMDEEFLNLVKDRGINAEAALHALRDIVRQYRPAQ